MGNTHPLNHVLLYWLSAALGKSRKHPSSVSLNFPLRFLSPYQEAVCAISTQGRSYSLARHKPLRSVGFGKQDPKSKLLFKTSTARRSSSAFLRPEQDVQHGEVSCQEVLERSKLFSGTSKTLWENSKTLRKWSDESLKSSSFFQTIFRSVCLGLLIDLLQTAVSSNLKVLPSEFGAGHNQHYPRSCFLSFRSIADSFY